MIHPDEPCVAVLSKPADTLALRTKVDVRGVGARLLTEHGVAAVLYLSMQDLASATFNSNGDLVFEGHRISVVYSRYDFSHPAPSLSRALDPRCEGFMAEWPAIERMERSTAVISSNLGCRLAHRRMVQFALHAAGGVERFLQPDEARRLRRVLPEQWSLAPDAPDVAAVRGMVREDPDGFVAKNMLRPRTGSGQTQDRKQSGGQIVQGREAMLALLTDEATSANYIVFRRIESCRHPATIVLEGRPHELAQAASEVATYGAFLAAPDGRVLVNDAAGMGVRTRPASRQHELSDALGYGAVNCVERAG